MENQQPPKQWWAPVWTGLVMDQDAKHCRQMKGALWLYLYFLLNANRRTGVLLRKIGTVSRDMGAPRGTVVRWLGVLRTQGYITTTNTGRSLTIQVTRWKAIGAIAKLRHQKTQSFDTGYAKSAIPAGPANPRVSLRNSSLAAASNETKIKIIINNETGSATSRARGSGFTSVGAHIRTELLARHLAESLDDPAGIELYRSYCARFPERLLRDVLSEVQQIPTDQITKGRGALFTYLVQHYAKGRTEDPGH